jgi:hypothetical protein
MQQSDLLVHTEAPEADRRIEFVSVEANDGDLIIAARPTERKEPGRGAYVLTSSPVRQRPRPHSIRPRPWSISMDEKDTRSAFISALTTEHFVLQNAVDANTSEVGTRASLYLFFLSSSLVAMGFASQSAELFVPFVAIVLPAVFILGLFTAVRLVDSNLEANVFLNGIARIRQYYRTLAPDAAGYFAPETGQWPENPVWPALRLGNFVGLITTTASMIAFINSIVAGVGVALLAGGLFREKRTLLASLIGAGVALLLMAGFYAYQKWRYDSAPR